MNHAADELTASIRSSRIAFSHNLTKGEAVEAAVREFFREHYPSSIGIARGQVIDAKGQESKQLDIIVYDAARTPILYSDKESGERLIPVEGVLAAVEAKTHLKLSDIPKLAESAEILNSLDRSAYYLPNEILIKSTSRAYGREWKVIPPLYLVMAFEGPELRSLENALSKSQQNKPFHKRIDMVCILDRGTTVNRDKLTGLYDTLPSPRTQVHGVATEKALMLFHVLASRYLLQMHIPPIALQRYVPPIFDASG